MGNKGPRLGNVPRVVQERRDAAARVRRITKVIFRPDFAHPGQRRIHSRVGEVIKRYADDYRKKFEDPGAKVVGFMTGSQAKGYARRKKGGEESDIDMGLIFINSKFGEKIPHAVQGWFHERSNRLQLGKIKGREVVRDAHFFDWINFDWILGKLQGKLELISQDHFLCTHIANLFFPIVGGNLTAERKAIIKALKENENGITAWESVRGHWRTYISWNEGGSLQKNKMVGYLKEKGFPPAEIAKIRQERQLFLLPNLDEMCKIYDV